MELLEFPRGIYGLALNLRQITSVAPFLETFATSKRGTLSNGPAASLRFR
jgi:hypothetical protein